MQGDSLTNGTGATGLNGYAQLVRTRLLQSYTDAGPGFIHLTSSSVTRTGFGAVLPTVSVWTRRGTTGDTVAITQDMTECQLMFYDISAAYAAEVSIDGGAYSALSMGATGSLNHRLVTIDAGAPGVHTVTIRATSANLDLDGFVVYTQPATTPSLSVCIIGLSGMAGRIPQSPGVFETSPDCFEGHIRLLRPDLATFMFTTNDHSANYTQEELRAGLDQYVAATQLAGGEALLLGPMAPNIIRNYTWRQRVESIRQASRDRNCVFVDTNAVNGDTYNASLLSDTLHPNDAGHAIMRDAVLAVI
jgi:lysophospholipase L1-like esterase